MLSNGSGDNGSGDDDINGVEKDLEDHASDISELSAPSTKKIRPVGSDEDRTLKVTINVTPKKLPRNVGTKNGPPTGGSTNR